MPPVESADGIPADYYGYITRPEADVMHELPVDLDGQNEFRNYVRGTDSRVTPETARAAHLSKIAVAGYAEA